MTFIVVIQGLEFNRSLGNFKRVNRNLTAKPNKCLVRR